MSWEDVRRTLTLSDAEVLSIVRGPSRIKYFSTSPTGYVFPPQMMADLSSRIAEEIMLTIERERRINKDDLIAAVQKAVAVLAPVNDSRE